MLLLVIISNAAVCMTVSTVRLFLMLVCVTVSMTAVSNGPVCVTVSRAVV